MQDLVETDFKFYRRINDDQAVNKRFFEWLFDRYREEMGDAA